MQFQPKNDHKSEAVKASNGIKATSKLALPLVPVIAPGITRATYKGQKTAVERSAILEHMYTIAKMQN